MDMRHKFKNRNELMKLVKGFTVKVRIPNRVTLVVVTIKALLQACELMEAEGTEDNPNGYVTYSKEQTCAVVVS